MSSPAPEPHSGERPEFCPPEFQTIYDEFQPKIRRYLSRLVGATDAEDLTQEVFVKSVRHSPCSGGSPRCPRGSIELPRIPPSIDCGVPHCNARLKGRSKVCSSPRRNRSVSTKSSFGRR